MEEEFADLKVNGLMALSPKGPEEPLPDFHLEKAEEPLTFHPVPVESVARLEEPRVNSLREDNKTAEINNIEGPERKGVNCCGSGWLRVCG